MDVRIRLPELMRDARISTAYALSKRSGGRISSSAAHRLVASDGVVRYMDADLLDVLCEVFGVEPAALLTQEPAPPKKSTPTKRG